jgi:dephospho-CoA kinase
MAILRRLGATTIDADEVYHGLIKSGMPLCQALVDHFGERIATENGQIDRRVLAEIVFRDPVALAELDQITHPFVASEIDRMIATTTKPVVAVDAIKLVESGMTDRYDSIWVVVCDPRRQIERLLARGNISEDEALRRIAAQPPLSGKLAAADVVIDNNGRPSETEQQVRDAWSALKRMDHVSAV